MTESISFHPFQGIAIYLHVLPVIRFPGAKCTSFGSRIDLNNPVSGIYWPIQSFPVVARGANMLGRLS